jgi:hypothetical protein
LLNHEQPQVQHPFGINISMSDVVTKPPLNRILFALLGREQLVYDWWNSANRAFDGQTPEAVYQSGPAGRIRVRDYLMAQALR